jgi:hypothetical protein
VSAARVGIDRRAENECIASLGAELVIWAEAQTAMSGLDKHHDQRKDLRECSHGYRKATANRTSWQVIAGARKSNWSSVSLLPREPA